MLEETPAATVLAVECALLRLETTLERAEPGAAAMVFMEELGFPDRPSIPPKPLKAAKRPAKASSRASVGMVSGLAVTFDHRFDRPGPRFYEFFAENEDPVALDPGFDDRLLEGARFVTATIATPVMRETILGQKRVLELARNRPSNKGHLIQPPLFVPGHEAEFHRLFARYFEYSRNDARAKATPRFRRKLRESSPSRVFSLTRLRSCSPSPWKASLATIISARWASPTRTRRRRWTC